MTLKNISSSTAPKSNAVKATDVASTALSKSDLSMPAQKPGASAGVGVNVSEVAKNRAADQKKAMDIAKNTPDVREDRVAAIKAKLDAGTYKIDEQKIANGMVREALMEHLATDKDR